MAKRDYATQQSLDQQQAKVDQLKGMIAADEGGDRECANATFLRDDHGAVGFRQLDAGNIIRPTDTQPLTVLTQIKTAQ